RHILNADLFAQLPQGASLVQVGRGGHLDQEALLASLDAGHLEAAFIDVTDPEPLPVDHPLWSHPKVVLTPHVAAHTRAESSAEATIANLRRILAGEAPNGLIDFQRGYCGRFFPCLFSYRAEGLGWRSRWLSFKYDLTFTNCLVSYPHSG